MRCDPRVFLYAWCQADWSSLENGRRQLGLYFDSLLEISNCICVYVKLWLGSVALNFLPARKSPCKNQGQITKDFFVKLSELYTWETCESFDFESTKPPAPQKPLNLRFAFDLRSDCLCRARRVLTQWHTYIHTYIHTYTHLYIHTSIHTYIREQSI